MKNAVNIFKKKGKLFLLKLSVRGGANGIRYLLTCKKQNIDMPLKLLLEMVINPTGCWYS